MAPRLLFAGCLLVALVGVFGNGESDDCELPKFKSTVSACYAKFKAAPVAETNPSGQELKQICLDRSYAKSCLGTIMCQGGVRKTYHEKYRSYMELCESYSGAEGRHLVSVLLLAPVVVLLGNL